MCVCAIFHFPRNIFLVLFLPIPKKRFFFYSSGENFVQEGMFFSMFDVLFAASTADSVSSSAADAQRLCVLLCVCRFACVGLCAWVEVSLIEFV